MKTQPPISTRRAGLGCLTFLLLVTAPWAMYAALNSHSTLARIAVFVTSVSVGLLIGPFVIGWALGVDSIPPVPSDGWPPYSNSGPVPGPDDPVFFLATDDHEGRWCHDPARHDPHRRFWACDMPYDEYDRNADQIDHHHVKITGSTWCGGR